MVNSDGVKIGPEQTGDLSVSGLVDRGDALARSMELRAAVLLNENAQLRQYSPGLQCNFWDGRLSVSGPLPSFYLKQMVQETLRNLVGVVQIDNRINVVHSVVKWRVAFPGHVGSIPWSKSAGGT
jgi:hypothetical protein